MTSKQRNIPPQAGNAASAHDLIAVCIWDHFSKTPATPDELGHFLARARPIVIALKTNKKPTPEEMRLKELLQFLMDIHDLLQSKTTFNNQRFPAIADAIDKSVRLTIAALEHAAKHIEQSVAKNQQNNLKGTTTKTTYYYSTPKKYTECLCSNGDPVATYYNQKRGIHTLLSEAHTKVQKILSSNQVLDAIAEGATRFSFSQFLKAFFAIFTRGPSPSQKPEIPFLKRCKAVDPHLAGTYGSLYHSPHALETALSDRKRQREEEELKKQQQKQISAAENLTRLIDKSLKKIPMAKVVEASKKNPFKKFSPAKIAQFQQFLEKDPVVRLVREQDPFLNTLVDEVLKLDPNRVTGATFGDTEICALRALKDYQKEEHGQTKPVSQSAPTHYTPGLRPGC